MPPLRPLFCLVLLSACTEVGLNARVNEAPVVEILNPLDGDTVLEGYATLLQGKVSDDRGVEQVVATWFVDGVELCSEPPMEDGGTVCNWTVPPGDSARIRLEVQDDEGEFANEQVDVTIQLTEPPTVVITDPTPDRNLYNNAPVDLQGVAQDAEDAEDDLIVTWSSDADGPLPGAEAAPDIRGVFSSTQLLSEGPHTLTATVTDLSGKTGVATVAVVVGGPNTPPTCELTAPADGSFSGQFNEVVFAAIVDDVDIPADELLVTFASDRDGPMATPTPSVNGDVVLPWDALSIGEHVITLTVVDDGHATCTDSVTHTVVEPPTAPVVHVEPDPPQSVDDLLCVIDVPSVDPQGDALTYVFTWTYDSVPFDPLLAWTTTWPGDTVPGAYTAPGQVWECEGRATDGQTDSSPGLDSVTVVTPTVVRADAGVDHSCQIDTNSQLECWGTNSLGELLLSGGEYVDVTLGNNHTCGIDVYGGLVCSGYDADGQASPPVGSGWLDVDAGDAHTCAVLGDHSVTCWGNDADGQTSGAATQTGRYDTVSVNFRHSCAVDTSTNQVDCWGSDTFGRSTPTPGVSWSQISTGRYHTCGLDVTGLAHCFGQNTNGEASPPGGTFDKISAGSSATCGLRGTGGIECWGLDTGPGEPLEPPVGLFIDVDLGTGHACAVDTAGSVTCWGDNSYGELDNPVTWW